MPRRVIARCGVRSARLSSVRPRLRIIGAIASRFALGGLCLALLGSAAPAIPAPAEPGSKHKATQTGLASYYSRRFDGKKTAGGTTFDNDELVAAHASYPLGTLVRVTNVQTGDSVDVRITDRGASRRNRQKGVIIDVSQAAAKQLHMKKHGKVRVRVEVLKWGEDEHKPLPPVRKGAG